MLINSERLAAILSGSKCSGRLFVDRWLLPESVAKPLSPPPSPANSTYPGSRHNPRRPTCEHGYTAYTQDIQEVTLTKRLVDVDDDLLEQARRILGTTTLKDTVNESLRGTIRTAHRKTLTKEDLAAFAEAAKDLGNPEVMARAWK